MVRDIPVRNEPAILMSILGIHQVALEHKKLGITKEVLAAHVLPFLIPLAVENCLNPSQVSYSPILSSRAFSLLQPSQPCPVSL